jgi:hypothetical protein
MQSIGIFVKFCIGKPAWAKPLQFRQAVVFKTLAIQLMFINGRLSISAILPANSFIQCGVHTKVYSVSRKNAVRLYGFKMVSNKVFKVLCFF